MQDFRKFLDEQKIPYTEADLLENNDWVRSQDQERNLRRRVSARRKGLKVRAEGDPQVMKALDLLPQAKALAENARKVIAERASARVINR